MIIDAHGHIGPTLSNHGGRMEVEAVRADDAVAMLDRAGIDKAIIFAPLYEGGSYNDPDYYLGNYVIAEACAEFPERFIGYGRVNPNRLGAATAELRHCLDDYGLRGSCFIRNGSRSIRATNASCGRWPRFVPSADYPFRFTRAIIQPVNRCCSSPWPRRFRIPRCI